MCRLLRINSILFLVHTPPRLSSVNQFSRSLRCSVFVRLSFRTSLFRVFILLAMLFDFRWQRVYLIWASTFFSLSFFFFACLFNSWIYVKIRKICFLWKKRKKQQRNKTKKNHENRFWNGKIHDLNHWISFDIPIFISRFDYFYEFCMLSLVFFFFSLSLV